ncbi:hypothetical protein XELAEV_18047666mg [Xenopus laevis]|uniref:Uncharacterized protein n=1 Tax=Xenopus laevis TaxID=8355 RepID=A0A974H1S6_XENLA|nr:hypothetical protein XELAEV_18047666mg [Xenopus laevis]
MAAGGCPIPFYIKPGTGFCSSIAQSEFCGSGELSFHDPILSSRGHINGCSLVPSTNSCPISPDCRHLDAMCSRGSWTHPVRGKALGG